MTEAAEQFGFRNVVLHKDQPLGCGSYGAVYKAECDGVACAAKIMHTTLFGAHDRLCLQKFEKESHLSLARHPNIVQYLGTCQDPETHLPVLLMELCDESLTRFLERSPAPLPHHTELSISHDIALALVYLHLNGLIHRDLTGNNILIAGTRAKVTDFGMSKLAEANRKTSLTLCPGNVLYMSPEALDEHPTYTEKLDIFSYGVLLVQIMTRQFPSPSDRFQVIDDPRYPDKIRIPVPESERRHNHVKLIRDSHPLKSVALQCLKNKETERPSAQEVSVRLSELKKAPQYAQSMQQAQTSSERNEEAGSEPRRQVRNLQQQNTEQQQQTQPQEREKSKDQNMQQKQLNTGNIDQVKTSQVTTRGDVQSQENIVRVRQSDWDYEFKIILLGDYGVGKTSIIQRYVHNTFSPTTPTLGRYVAHLIKVIDVQGKRIRLIIWDTAGMERFDGLDDHYYRRANGVILVVDVKNKYLDRTEHWISDIRGYAPEKVKSILAVSKCDLLKECERAYSEEAGTSLTSKFDMPIWETSAKTGHNISMVFEVLANAILNDHAVEENPNPTIDLHSQLKLKKKMCC